MTEVLSPRPTTVVYCAISLDGFIARPDGGIDWLDLPEEDENEDYGWGEFIPQIDHIVMGRATFEKVLEFGTWPYGDTPLTVLSTTLKSVPEEMAEHEVRVASMEPRALLDDLWESGCRRVYVDGGRTVRGFLADDLIDELVLTTIPVLIGEGIALFGPVGRDLSWTHASTETFAQGLVKSHYVRDRDR